MIGSIISAGASLLGGLFGNKAQKDANEAMLADKEKDRQLQREFAQSGIQWRVQDAKAAGVHPVYALGGSGASYTPSSISLGAESALGNAFSSAGQDIGRAVDATRSSSGRVDAFTQKVQGLTLQKMGLENELLGSQIAKNRAQLGPPMPTASQQWLIPGQGQTAVAPAAGPDLIKDKALERTVSDPSAPHNEPGAINYAGFTRTPYGSYYPLPSKDVKERIEDVMPHEWSHYIANNLLPTIGFGSNPPYRAPENKRWVYEPMYGYHLVDSNVFSRWFGRR